MVIKEYLSTALEQFKAGKMRAFLTILGITIGIATVIFIVAVLEGYNKSITKELNILGANTFQVQRNDPVQVGGPRFEKKTRKILKKELADRIRKNCSLVAGVAPEVYIHNALLIYRDKKTNPNFYLVGTEADYFENNGYSTSEGRILTNEDVFFHRRVVVLGMDAVDILFPFENPLGKWVKIQGSKFKVIGILEEMGSSTFGQSRDNRVVVPITVFEDLWGKFRSVNITIRVKPGADFEEAQSQVIGVLRKARKVPPGKDNDFAVFSNETLENSFNNIADKVKIGAVFLGLISLLVGSIGVMNIMLVTVTERTREIGIRKAVGGRRRDILLQFLNEAIVLTLIGGIIGILLGFAMAGVVALFLKIPFVAPLWVVLTSLLVTALVGLLAGLYPAARAAKMDPINALRYE